MNDVAPKAFGEAKVKVESANFDDMHKAARMMLTSMARSKNDLVNAVKSRQRKAAKRQEKEQMDAQKAETKRKAEEDKKQKDLLKGQTVSRQPPQAWEIFKLSGPQAVH